MKFSTDFKKTINTKTGGFWDNEIETQIVLDSEEDNTNKSIVNIDTEHIKCKFDIPNDGYISNEDINKLIDSFLFDINKLSKKDYYKYSEVINILLQHLLQGAMYNNELLYAVLDNDTYVDEYVYDEEYYEQGED